jgi:FecR-like protein
MAYTTAIEGGFEAAASIIHADSSSSEHVSVPDADLLFRGDYHRAGPDLVLTGHDGRHHIVPGYFASEKHAALVAPNGASLSADVVDLLAGSPAPGQYAQAQPTTPPDSIGKVEKVVGDVTVVRNGVSVALHVGDAVFKSDVIATGGDSSAGISFPDGTVLDLVANSRMALNEYSFEPNGANNGAVFTLVEGTFGFVAGQVAQDNHMSVVTPVATMGIRGTAGIVRHEFRANAGDLLYSFLVLDEVDIRRHGHHVGSYEVRDNRPDSPTFGEILQYIADSGYVTSVELQGSGLPPIVRTELITNSRLSDDRLILQDLVDSYGQFLGGNHGPGSGDSPNQLFGPQIFQEIPGVPFTFNPPPPNPGGSAPAVTPTVFIMPLPPNPPPGPSSNVFIWDGGDGPYPTQNWSQPGVPNAPVDIVEILSGTVVYPAADNFTIGELIIGPGATLDMVGGTLTVLGLVIDGKLIGVVDSGMIIVEGDPPTLVINGTTTVMSGGGFLATGSGDEIEFTGNVFNSGSLTASAESVGIDNNAGCISASDGGTVSFEASVWNEGGTIKAWSGGLVTFSDSTVTNEICSTIEANGCSSQVDFSWSSVCNDARIEAKFGGVVDVSHSTITQSCDGVLAATGCNSEVNLDHATVVGGTLETSCGGLIQTTCGDSVFDGVTIACGSNVLVNDQTSLALRDTIDNHGTITLAAAPDPSLVIDGCVTLTGHGEIVLSGDGDNIVGGACGGTLDNVDNTISGAGSIGDGQLTLINESCGVIDANLAGQTLTVDTGNAVINKGTLEASNGGTLQVDDAVTGGGSALVAGGVVHFEQTANISEITFNNGGETPTYGEVIFDNPNGLNATVNGFTGTESATPSLANTDEIDLAGVWTVESETPSGGNLVVELQDGTQVATLTFDGFTGTLNIGSDGSGGTLITDPPAASHPSPTDGAGAFTNVALNWANDQINLAPAQTETQSAGGSVTYGGPGNDNFVFQPGIGADTVTNFNPRVDTIELDHFANIQNVQQLAALIGTDAHGDAVIELGHNDSITLPGVTQSYLQAHLQSLVHLG